MVTPLREHFLMFPRFGSEAVLIHAAAGGVGSIAGQIARHLGAGLVIGTVSSFKKAAYAQPFGYNHVILRDGFQQRIRELTNGRGVDSVLEAIGEPVRSQSLSILAPFGRLVIFGNANDGQGKPQALPLNPGDVLVENKAIHVAAFQQILHGKGMTRRGCFIRTGEINQDQQSTPLSHILPVSHTRSPSAKTPIQPAQHIKQHPTYHPSHPV
jgi:threonine dehydrogenase-like Zn-dependent dehydrogenase